MVLAAFDPPGNLNDLTANQKRQWSTAVSGWIDEMITALQGQAGDSQFYNPARRDPPAPPLAQSIVWNGFPKSLRMRYGRREAWKQAEVLTQLPGHYRVDDGTRFYRRRMDEYLEWFVDRPNADTIRRVTFTAEPPEYWSAIKGDSLYSYDGATEFPFDAAPAKLLELYRFYVSPDVQAEDLVFAQDWLGNDGRLMYAAGEYNPYNKWNTSDGIMHLTHQNNSLRAEIKLAADATLLWHDSEDVLLCKPDELICCAGYGGANRSSDPTIGGSVNQLARLGHWITLANPIGLYIDSINMTGFVCPDGGPVTADFWRVERGSAENGMIERAVFEVPDERGFTVDQITIGGEPIEYGGQIAEHITVRLTGLAAAAGAFDLDSQLCVCHCCLDHAQINLLQVEDYATDCGDDSSSAFLKGQGGDYRASVVTAVQAVAPGAAEPSAVDRPALRGSVPLKVGAPRPLPHLSRHELPDDSV